MNCSLTLLFFIRTGVAPHVVKCWHGVADVAPGVQSLTQVRGMLFCISSRKLDGYHWIFSLFQAIFYKPQIRMNECVGKISEILRPEL